MLYRAGRWDKVLKIGTVKNEPGRIVNLTLTDKNREFGHRVEVKNFIQSSQDFCAKNGCRIKVLTQ